jgi:hypothetical protein
MSDKCWLCGKKFGDDERVIPVCRYITNEKRGDFIGQASDFIHATHLRVDRS